MGNRKQNDKIEEMKELSQPKNEEVIASIQQEENINILTRWVPKINSEGKKKPVTRLKKGEHTRYLRSMASRGNRRQRTDKKVRQNNQRSSTQNQYNKGIIRSVQICSSGENRRNGKLCHEIHEYLRRPTTKMGQTYMGSTNEKSNTTKWNRRKRYATSANR